MRDIFAKLLRPEIFLDISNVNSIDVVEEGNKDNNGLRHVKISGIPSGSVAFSLDHKPSKELVRKFGKIGCDRLSWLFNDNHTQVNKKCDFVIISPLVSGTEKRCRILLGELKSKTIKEKNYQTQLINSRLYMIYVLSLLKKYHSFEFKPVFKYVILSNKEKFYRSENKSPATRSAKIFDLDEEPHIPNRKVEHNRIHYNKII